MRLDYADIIGAEDPEIAVQLVDFLDHQAYTIRWFTETDSEYPWTVVLDGATEANKDVKMIVSPAGMKMTTGSGALPFITRDDFELADGIRVIMDAITANKAEEEINAMLKEGL